MPFCYICGSTHFVDKHHYDCKEGSISPETVPLCRRCHRTYHDWGIAAFSPDTTERALEVENKRRLIYHLPLMKMTDIQRSSYWGKKWGITTKKQRKPSTLSPQLPLFNIEDKTLILS